MMLAATLADYSDGKMVVYLVVWWVGMLVGLRAKRRVV